MLCKPFRLAWGSYQGYWGRYSALSHPQPEVKMYGAVEHRLRNGRKIAAFIVISLAEGKL